MRDIFQKALHKKIFNVRKKVVLPTDGLYSSLLDYDTVLEINLSFDNIDRFIRLFESDLYYIDVPIDITIYDEEKISKNEDILKRYKLISILNELPIARCIFNLSDENISFYSNMLNQTRFKWSTNSLVNMTLDRNLLKDKDYLELSSIPTYINLKEETLMTLPNRELRRIESKLIHSGTVKYTIGLRKVVDEVMERMDSIYWLGELSSYEKIYMINKFINENITYPERYTYTGSDGKIHVQPECPEDVFNPYLTYKNKEGLCVGQSRLMVALLNNSYMNVPSFTISGDHPMGGHEWVGSIVDGNLIETCVTLNGPFKDLRGLGYKYDKTEIYPRVYNQAYLLDSDISTVAHKLELARKK